MTHRRGIRTFVALGLPEAMQESLDRLQGFIPGGRLTETESYHLTLAFLDTQPEAVLAEVTERLCEIQAGPVAVALRGIDLNSVGRRSMVWVRAVRDPALTELRRKVRGAIVDAGVHPGRDRFRPHVTLTRIGVRAGGCERSGIADFVARHSDFALEPVTVDSFQLYRSTLSETGSVYDILWNFPLGR